MCARDFGIISDVFFTISLILKILPIRRSAMTPDSTFEPIFCAFLTVISFFETVFEERKQTCNPHIVLVDDWKKLGHVI